MHVATDAEVMELLTDGQMELRNQGRRYESVL